MALSFPANPSVNDTYTEGSRSWKWNGTKWELVISTLVAGSVSTAEINNGAVTTAKLADGAVTAVKLGPGIGGGLDTEAEGAISIMDIGS